MPMDGSWAVSAPRHHSWGIDHRVPMTFIRAPYIDKVGDGVEVLAQVDGRMVAARQGRQLVTAFHPELDDDTAVHRLFLESIRMSR